MKSRIKMLTCLLGISMYACGCGANANHAESTELHLQNVQEREESEGRRSGNR